MEGSAAGSLREEEVKADGRRGAWKGANEKNDTEIREREVRGQLQQASPAAASIYGLAEGDKMAAEAAADGAAAPHCPHLASSASPSPPRHLQLFLQPSYPLLPARSCWLQLAMPAAAVPAPPAPGFLRHSSRLRPSSCPSSHQPSPRPL